LFSITVASTVAVLRREGGFLCKSKQLVVDFCAERLRRVFCVQGRWAWGNEVPSEIERTLAPRRNPYFVNVRLLILFTASWAAILVSAPAECGSLATSEGHTGSA
jgi:hypothetical protein